MLRHRQVAAAPERLASETWEVISKLVGDTLERSPNIARADIDSAMTAAAPVGRMLIAGGHLDRHPLVVVAPPVHLSIMTVSGTAASTTDENLAPVPGGASADEWMIHLPTPEPVTANVQAIAKLSAHLTAEPAPAAITKAAEAGDDVLVDLDALSRRTREE